jgi:hypothetical protein
MVFPCYSCDGEFLKMDLYYGPEPFILEVRGKEQLVHLCRECFKNSLLDI